MFDDQEQGGLNQDHDMTGRKSGSHIQSNKRGREATDDGSEFGALQPFPDGGSGSWGDVSEHGNPNEDPGASKVDPLSVAQGVRAIQSIRSGHDRSGSVGPEPDPTESLDRGGAESRSPACAMNGSLLSSTTTAESSHRTTGLGGEADQGPRLMHHSSKGEGSVNNQAWRSGFGFALGQGSRPDPRREKRQGQRRGEAPGQGGQSSGQAPLPSQTRGRRQGQGQGQKQGNGRSGSRWLGGNGGTEDGGEGRPARGADTGGRGCAVEDVGEDGSGVSEPRSDDREEGQEEDEPQCVMAICRHGTKLGIAAYKEGENTIEIQETHAFQSDMTDTLEGIKMLVRPSLILTDVTMLNNQALYQLVVAPLVEGGADFNVRLMKRSSWDYDSAVRSACANLLVGDLMGRSKVRDGEGFGVGAYTARGEGGVEPGPSTEEAFNLLNSVIDFQSVQQVRALGALLVYLQGAVFNLEPNGTVPIRAIRQISGAGSMRVDTMTLRSLGILAEEFHPNLISGRGRSKEGFSVFGLFDRARSAAGRRCLKEWMLKPLQDISAISARQDGVELMMKPENSEIVRQLRSLLGKSHDMARTLLRIKKVSSNCVDWCRLLQALESTLAIQDVLEILWGRGESPAHANFLKNIIESVDAPKLRQCQNTVSAVIDPVATAEAKELVIRPGCYSQLDDLKQTMDGLDQLLRTVGQVVLEANPLLEELSVEYVPQIGFLIALTNTAEELVPQDFSFAFTQGDVVYYKNAHMLELDDEIGDIQAQIADLQSALIRSLEEEVLELEATLHNAATAMGELDATLSLAAVAADFGYVRPEVVEQDVIIIKNGRHPLQEMTVDTFIPNDTYVADNSRVVLITGANCSGKSVYVKQVGVIVFLAHVGSFVPAERAMIGLTDRIFTRIATVETSALPQSSFAIDLNQVSGMLRNSTRRSLLLIDEFGKGTAPADGVSLMAATIKYLAKTGGGKALLTLHFHEIFSQGLVGIFGANTPRTDLDGVSVFRMDVHMQGESTDSINGGENGGAQCPVAGPATPLFKLVPGVSASSHGIACARSGGMPEDVLARAEEIARCMDERVPIPPVEGGGRREGALTLRSPEVQDCLRLFLQAPIPWQRALDSQLSSFLSSLEDLRELPETPVPRGTNAVDSTAAA